MNNKKSLSLALGIAFVGFTTQFGGGFASGAQIYQYFINYGVWALVTPFIAQGLLSFFYCYGMKYAHKNKVYDYRSFSDKFYGKYKGIFSNLYEIEYIVMVCMAPAVAFATGGSTLNKLTNIPYLACTIIIGVFIFLVTIFGSKIVRKCSSILSIIIITGLLIVLIPNIIVHFNSIVEAFKNMSNNIMPIGSSSTGSFGSALWNGCVYGIFQITAIGLMYQHVKEVKDEKTVGKSMIFMFIIDSVIMMLAVLGLSAIAYNSEILDYAVPMLLLVKTGVGAKILTPIISILIILGAVSTGVNMIAGIVERTVNEIEKRRKSKSNHKKYIIIVTMIFTLITFAIAQFGLINLVKVGYSYIGYATIIVIIIPFIIHLIYSKTKKGEKTSDIK